MVVETVLGFGYSMLIADLAQGENSVVRTIGGEALKSAFLGPLGNLTYDKTREFYAHFRRGDEKNLNHHLQRAARKAQLTATLLAVRACLREFERLDDAKALIWSRASIWDYSDKDKTWLKASEANLRKQLKELPKTPTPQSPVEQTEIIRLFDPNENISPDEAQKLLIARLKQITLEEFAGADAPKDATNLLTEAVEMGWNETETQKTFVSSSLYPLNLRQNLINTEKEYDWFSLLCGLFNEEYKHDELVKAAMQKYLLLDIHNKQTGAAIEPKLIADVFAGQFEQLGDSFLRLEILLEKVEAKQDAILSFVKIQFLDLARRVDLATQTVIDEAEKTRQFIAELIRQEEALSPEKREAIKEEIRLEYLKEIAVEYDPAEVVGGFSTKDRFFVDRDAERADLKTRLLAGEKMIVVKAFSGYGKTSLVSEMLHEIAPEEKLNHPQVRGILLFYCKDKEQATLREVCRKADARLRKAGVKSSFAESYEAFKRESQNNTQALPTALVDKLIEALSAIGDEWLVFDNFESALDGETVRDAELRELFKRALETENRLRFLLTSQKVPQFEGVDGVESLELGDLPADFAKAYLWEKGKALKRLNVECGLAEADEAVLDTLLGATSAVPMRLVSFVGYLRELYVKKGKTLADAMADEKLMEAFREHDERKGALSLIARQYALLNAKEQLILQALSIFPKPVPFAAVRSVLPLTLEEDDILNCLLASSFVRRQGSTYELLTLPKEVISKQPDTADESLSRRAMHERAADFYESIRKPLEQGKTLADFEPQFEEMHHCREAGLFNRAANVLDAETNGLLRRFGYSRRLLEERKMFDGKPMSEHSIAYNSGCLALHYSHLGDKRTAIKYYEQSLAAYRKLNRKSDEGIMLGNIGIAYLDLGEKQKALEYYEQALIIHREVSNRVEEGRVLGNKGVTKFNLGEKEEGIELVEQALEIARQVEDKMFEEIWLKRLERMENS
ncbi:MAG TPA: tetratricopeptide repeat protein [Pyrinomonadaceae bacterium]|jgi:tetratricopeptide (TPR) repeat protein